MSSTNRGSRGGFELDHFATPAWCVDLLVPHLPPLAGRRLGELSAGRGDVVKALLVHGADPGLVTAVEIEPRRAAACRALGVRTIEGDALDPALGLGPYDLIVGNPPYGDAEAHVRRSCALLAPGGTCALLLRLAFVMEAAERRDLRRAHPCDVLVLDKRPSFTAEILTWATEADLLAMALPRKGAALQRRGPGLETVEEVRARLRGVDSCAYAWALYGEGRGGRYQVLEVP